MHDLEALRRLEDAAADVATQFGGAVRAIELSPGAWLAAVEPISDSGSVLVRGEGPTRAMALSDLIRNAKKHGAT
jgi:hypothetical protein